MAAELDKESHQLAYEVLKSTASWLEDPDNEILSLLEENDTSVELAADACVHAAHILKKVATDIQLVSGIDDQSEDVTVALDKLRAIANELDSSNDPNLVKKASMLDEILLTVAADVEAQNKFRARMSQKIEALKKNSQQRKIATESASKEEKKEDSKPAEDKSTGSASTRVCREHPGAQLYRMEDGSWKCTLGGETITDERSIENQTKLNTFLNNPMVIESTRENRNR